MLDFRPLLKEKSEIHDGSRSYTGCLLAEAADHPISYQLAGGVSTALVLSGLANF